MEAACGDLVRHGPPDLDPAAQIRGDQTRSDLVRGRLDGCKVAAGKRAGAENEEVGG